MNIPFLGSKERDIETGLDFFGARYFASAQGRFTSPDDFWKDSQVADPQSWNKYAYVRNNPLKYVDLTGEKATVTIETDEEHKRGTIKISASFAIWTKDSSISSGDLNKAATDIKSTIQNAWKGTFTKDGITYTVEATIDVQVKVGEADAGKSGAQNIIELTNGSATPGIADSFVRPNPLFGGPDTGVWNINSLTKVAGHEFTHLLGVGDHSGSVLSNTDILNDSSIPGVATSSDFGWSIGGSIDFHRRASQPTEMRYGLNTGVMMDKRPPRSSTTTRELRAAKIWWR